MTKCNVVTFNALPAKCYVHDQPAPCLLDGAPAAAHPIHVFAQPLQATAVKVARNLSCGSRPIRIHQGAEGDMGHILEPGRDCWCETVTIPAS